MANIHVAEFSALGNVEVPDASPMTYTRLASAGAADSVVIAADTILVEIWGEAAFGYSFDGVATANSAWLPAGVLVHRAGVAGKTLSVFAAS